METLKRILSYLKPYRTKFYYSMICMIVIAASQAAIVYLTKPIFDQLFINKQKELIPFIIKALLLTSLLKFIFTYWQSYLLSWIGQTIVKDIRNEMYEKLLNLSLGYFIKSSTGQLISRLTYDIAQVQRGIIMIPRNTFRDGLQIIFYVGILFYLNWKWSIVTFISFPIIALILTNIGKKIKRRAKRVQEQTASIYSTLQEKISGIKLIKSVTNEGNEIQEMKKQNEGYFNIFMRLTRADILQSPLIEFIGLGGVALVIFWGTLEVIGGSVTTGTFVAFIATALSMYKPAKALTEVNTDIQTMRASGERIFELLDKKPTVIESADAAEMQEFKKDIKFDNVSFEYETGKGVLFDINFVVEKGDLVAIVGPSGSGKTTLINLLARFFDPTKGIITIDGNDIKGLTLKSLRSQMGIVTQETILFNDSVSNNISYGTADKNFTDIEHSAMLANASYFIEKLSKRYDTVIGEKGATLSGGEKQRIAIARVILRNPQILILDEATSALDSESEMLVQDALAKIMKEKTTIVIAHRLSTVKSADKIIVIDKGKIVATGTHSELIEKSTMYKQLYIRGRS